MQSLGDTGTVYDMEAGDGQCPRRGDETSCHDELRFVSQTSIRLLFLWEVAVEQFMENCGMADVLVRIIDPVPDFSNLSAEVLRWIVSVFLREQYG